MKERTTRLSLLCHHESQETICLGQRRMGLLTVPPMPSACCHCVMGLPCRPYPANRPMTLASKL